MARVPPLEVIVSEEAFTAWKEARAARLERRPPTELEERRAATVARIAARVARQCQVHQTIRHSGIGTPREEKVRSEAISFLAWLDQVTAPESA